MHNAKASDSTSKTFKLRNHGSIVILVHCPLSALPKKQQQTNNNNNNKQTNKQTNKQKILSLTATELARKTLRFTASQYGGLVVWLVGSSAVFFSACVYPSRSIWDNNPKEEVGRPLCVRRKCLADEMSVSTCPPVCLSTPSARSSRWPSLSLLPPRSPFSDCLRASLFLSFVCCLLNVPATG